MTTAEVLLPDRCPDCDAPLATQADWDGHEDGCMCRRCRALCWRAWLTRCEREPMDWRTRAIKAEATRAAVIEECARVADATATAMGAIGPLGYAGAKEAANNIRALATREAEPLPAAVQEQEKPR